ncbi:hypothetical protein PSECIP111951_01727 [Pseudoalteromonas holothuriae]|uniref:Uncharacterized protein n=2 Tax=Pseudoalteromonas TaxID=53246 RepID=A0ABM9GHD7_9GAMM|nr:hypothetical protein PCIT_a3069 [Pseudoalteromonas citrea]CAH9057726.1 hypothetical protein PSECIP111951_01727 [Pseudoalteromonas sp. CIP111951]
MWSWVFTELHAIRSLQLRIALIRGLFLDALIFNFSDFG